MEPLRPYRIIVDGVTTMITSSRENAYDQCQRNERDGIAYELRYDGFLLFAWDPTLTCDFVGIADAAGRDIT